MPQETGTEEIQEHMVSSWEKMLDRLANWVDTAILNLPNLLISIVIFLFTYWVSRYVQAWSSKGLKKFIKQASIRELISNFASIAIIAFGLFVALSVLNLDQVLKSILAGAGVAGLAVGLALQGTLSNTFSGIFLAIKDVINVGDWIETNGFSGRVMEINLRNTKLKESDNNLVIIPNKNVLDNPFKNFGLTPRIRITINCGVAYDSDLEQVQSIAIETIKDQFDPKPHERVEFHYLAFGASSIDFQLRFWIKATSQVQVFEAQSQSIISLKQAFDKNGIEIPFPIRTVIMQENPPKDDSEES